VMPTLQHFNSLVEMSPHLVMGRSCKTKKFKAICYIARQTKAAPNIIEILDMFHLMDSTVIWMEPFNVLRATRAIVAKLISKM